MIVIFYFVGSVLLTALILLAATSLPHASVSLYELRRRVAARDPAAEKALRREELLAQLDALKAPLGALMLIALLFVSIHLFGRTSGLLAAVLVAILHGRVAQIEAVRKFANSRFRRHETKILRFIDKYSTVIQFIIGRRELRDARPSLASREELAHVLEASDIFTNEDRVLVEHALRFRGRKVKQHMVPRDEMVTIKSTELLGPLVLDDLHKTGHTIFPVTKGKDIVGLLDSSDHVGLRNKESVHVREVMRTDITKIDQSARLDEALQVFVEVKQSLLIVVDDDNQVVGLLSLGDVVRALTGWKQE